MRDILFRGKRAIGLADEILENGEWVYGYVTKPRNLKNELYTAIIPAIDGEALNECVAIIPETVGQFTGLTDKNGKKVFEGDIVEDSQGIRKVVEYRATPCKSEVFACMPAGFSCRVNECYAVDMRPNDIVIGNIHENHELLKGE